MWQNWSEGQQAWPKQVLKPSGVDELKSFIAKAQAESCKVGMVGAGHSFTDVAVTDGYLLQLDPMNRILEHDPVTNTVKVEAGIRLHELNEQLWNRGLALRNLGDIDRQSIAGAASTGTHGTGLKLGNLASLILEIELVTASGETVVCSADSSPEIFHAAKVGVGSLGVITAYRLQCVPAFNLHGEDKKANLENTLKNIDQLVSENDHFEFFAFPYSSVAQTRTNNVTTEAPQPPSKAAAYFNDIVMTNYVFEGLCKTTARFPKLLPKVNDLIYKVAGSNTRIDRSYKVFASPRLTKFEEMEYAIPRAAGPEAVRAVFDFVKREQIAVNFPLEVRFGAPDDAYLSMGYEQESCYIAVHMYKNMAWERFFRGVERIMSHYGGRPHWGKRHFQTVETLPALYPKWEEFQTIRRQLDPDGLFSNQHNRRVFG